MGAVDDGDDGSGRARRQGAAVTGEPAGLLEIGRIGRPVGLQGEVTVQLLSNRPERVAPGAVLHTDTGQVRVRSSRTHGGRQIVAFEGMDTREQAEALRGVVLRAEPLQDPDEVWAHQLIGARVVDQTGADRGLVVHVLANPASDLLELDNGALVPSCFVTSLAPGGTVNVEVPEGLFELS